MPQMAPLSWLILFFVFTLSFIMFCIMNYFIYSPQPTLMKSSKKSFTAFNWKW
uniref:ATP synthase complex subunit 8 n=1 Tax=Neurigona zhejiangensis TaxID=2779314 RepID=A0A7M3UZQ0_9MUSC|nr:ATP synthase F0 subunit 8 [Neurigona zhejiangensis]QOL12427.1 ATP synthase F0 subunit 8 [Neurigona zhejiangensis]